MGHLKTFLLGMGAAYGIYYLTRKDRQGVSLLDELLADPRGFMNRAKDYAIDEALQKVEEQIS